jgi:hypothetical protein
MTESAIESFPRAAWDVIEEVCAARFTGQITLHTADRTTNVYMTRGLIYFAERSTDARLVERLARSGAIPPELLPVPSDGTQLENLDELFTGQPQAVRDPVEAVIQAETEKALMEIADRDVDTFESMMYRHHPSGIDRWFSSQHARSAGLEQNCTTEIVVDDGDAIEPAPEPELIPSLEPDEVPENVADAVRRTMSAIETATKTIGPAPKGFVRAPRSSRTA